MTKDEKLISIMAEYRFSWLTLHEALDKAYMEGRLEIATEYQKEINNRIDQMNEILDTVQEIKNGK